MWQFPCVPIRSSHAETSTVPQGKCHRPNHLQCFFEDQELPTPSVQVMHTKESPGTLHLWEIFSGSAHLSETAIGSGLRVLQPLDLKDGFDILDDSHFRALVSGLKTHLPLLVWMAPPCTCWCPLQRLMAKPDGLRKKLLEGREIMRRVAQVAELCVKLKLHFAVENPSCSRAWKESDLSTLSQQPYAWQARFDQCQFGLVDPFTDEPIRKRTVVLTNSSGLFFLTRLFFQRVRLPYPQLCLTLLFLW